MRRWSPEDRLCQADLIRAQDAYTRALCDILKNESPLCQSVVFGRDAGEERTDINPE